MFTFTEDATLLFYIPRKNKRVVLQSTLHKDKKVSNDSERKPEIILNYNKTKGSVVTLDKMIAHYSRRRKTSRWPNIVFANILDILVSNAFVLFVNVRPNRNVKQHFRRRLFIETVGEPLIKEYMARRVHVSRSTNCRQTIASSSTSTDQSSSLSTSATKVHKKRPMLSV